MKKVLVTGGLGFIGLNLIKKLNPENYKVYVIDNVSSHNADNIYSIDKEQLIIEDIDCIERYSLMLKGLDTVVHLAANTRYVTDDINDVRRTFDDIPQTVKLLQTAKKLGVKRFIFSSSAAVYGNTETSFITKYPVSFYGISKLAIENLLYLFPEITERVVLRFFNVYGPGNNKGVINNLITAFKRDLPVQLYCSNKNPDMIPSRDFIHIDDVVRVLKAAIDVEEYEFQPVFNIGTGYETSLIALVMKLSRMFGKVPRVDYLGNKEQDIIKSVADIKEMTRFFKIVPEITLDKGLEDMVKP